MCKLPSLFSLPLYRNGLPFYLFEKNLFLMIFLDMSLMNEPNGQPKKPDGVHHNPQTQDKLTSSPLQRNQEATTQPPDHQVPAFLVDW